jgi:chorismate mutase/prephenate dehydratase
LCEVASTSVAAAMAAEQPHGAAIAAWQAGVHHGLQVVAANIEDASDNVTRFVILGHHQPPRSGHDKTALMFQISHQAGALAETMQIFRRFRLNMTWIESFPLAGRPSEYLFFVELEGHRDQRRVRAAIERLGEDALRLEVLGSYPRAAVSES